MRWYTSVLIFLILLIGATVSNLRGQNYHPKSIQALRGRTFQAKDLTILNTVPAKDGLNAVEFSYISEGNLNYGLIERPAGRPPKKRMASHCTGTRIHTAQTVFHNEELPIGYPVLCGRWFYGDQTGLQGAWPFRRG